MGEWLVDWVAGLAQSPRNTNHAIERVTNTLLKIEKLKITQLEAMVEIKKMDRLDSERN